MSAFDTKKNVWEGHLCFLTLIFTSIVGANTKASVSLFFFFVFPDWFLPTSPSSIAPIWCQKGGVRRSPGHEDILFMSSASSLCYHFVHWASCYPLKEWTGSGSTLGKLIRRQCFPSVFWLSVWKKWEVEAVSHGYETQMEVSLWTQHSVVLTKKDGGNLFQLVKTDITIRFQIVTVPHFKNMKLLVFKTKVWKALQPLPIVWHSYYLTVFISRLKFSCAYMTTESILAALLSLRIYIINSCFMFHWIIFAFF